MSYKRSGSEEERRVRRKEKEPYTPEMHSVGLLACDTFLPYVVAW